MTKTTINNTIKFVFANQWKIRIVLFTIIMAILVSYGTIYHPSAVIGMLFKFIIPAMILILYINIITTHLAKKKHWIAKTIKYLLYFSKYFCIACLCLIWIMICGIHSGLSFDPMWNSVSIMVLSSILSLFLL